MCVLHVFPEGAPDSIASTNPLGRDMLSSAIDRVDCRHGRVKPIDKERSMMRLPARQLKSVALFRELGPGLISINADADHSKMRSARRIHKTRSSACCLVLR